MRGKPFLKKGAFPAPLSQKLKQLTRPRRQRLNTVPSGACALARGLGEDKKRAAKTARDFFAITLIMLLSTRTVTMRTIM